jgi:hypothetical protein
MIDFKNVNVYNCLHLFLLALKEFCLPLALAGLITSPASSGSGFFSITSTKS